MNIILIPGLWLVGSSWEPVSEALAQTGHTPRPITLPGMESKEDDRSNVGLSQAVERVIEEIDACHPDDGKVLLVGHSAGGGIAHAAVDARPDRIARVVYVGGFPTAAGDPIAGGFDVEDGEIPLPGWPAFDEADLVDMDDDVRRSFTAGAVGSPGRFTSDEQRLTSEARYAVPVTMICTEYTSEALQGWIEAGLEPVREIPKLHHVEYVDLPTGHWPQFTRPLDLAARIADRAFEPYVDEHHRLHPSPGTNEVLTGLAFLDFQRATLAWKAGGLDADQLAVQTADSSLTLGGILKHMALVEEMWFSRALHDRPWAAPWSDIDWERYPDWEFTSAVEDSPEDLFQLWRTATARSRALVAGVMARGGFDARAARAGEGDRPTLRWIVLHMIEEYARHNGHADLIRESVDGEVGE